MYICHNKCVQMTGAADGEIKRKQAKATNAQVAKRLREVYDLLLSGSSRPEILEYAKTKWGLSGAQADSYIARVRKTYLAAVAEGREAALERHLALRRDMLQRARKAGDLNAELQIARDEAKLRDLYPVERRDVTSGGEPIKGYVGISPDDWDEPKS